MMMQTGIATLVWVVTYRVDSKSPQQELTRYTQEAANHFAQGICDSGGVAIVTEEFQEAPPSNDDSEGPLVSDTRSLKW